MAVAARRRAGRLPSRRMREIVSEEGRVRARVERERRRRDGVGLGGWEGRRRTRKRRRQRRSGKRLVTVPVRRPSPSTGRPPSPRPVRCPPLRPKRSPRPSRQSSPSRSTPPGRSHSTRRRRLRRDNIRARCRAARGKGSQRTKASDRRASTLARCDSSKAITEAVPLTAYQEKDRRSCRKRRNSSLSSHQRRCRGQPPCRCSRLRPAPRPTAAQARPAGDRRSVPRPRPTTRGLLTWTGSGRSWT